VNVCEPGCNPAIRLRCVTHLHVLFTNSEILIGKLYKTDDGSWYNLPTNNSFNALLAIFLKMAIDESEEEKMPQ
jgi:hypothetical protein